MKGIVFTEFLDMVEQSYGYEMVDKIIEASKLESKGVYTSIGTYHHSEIVALLGNLSEQTGVPGNKLLHLFGKFLFDTFLKSYPQFFNAVDNAFDFLQSIDNHIHVEVKKLYPDAMLPKFETHTDEQGRLFMIYSSERKMADLAEGLIEKSIAHYKTPHKVEKESLNDDGSQVKFVITPV